MLISPATKAAAISDYLAGNGGYMKLAKKYGINPATLRRWINSPEQALNQNLQKGIMDLEGSVNDYTGLIERNDLETDNEPEFKTKDAEIKYLRDKILYLEKLSELMGYNPNNVSKKKDSKSFSIFSEMEDVQTLPDSAQSPEFPENVTMNTKNDG